MQFNCHFQEEGTHQTSFKALCVIPTESDLLTVKPSNSGSKCLYTRPPRAQHQSFRIWCKCFGMRPTHTGGLRSFSEPTARTRTTERWPTLHYLGEFSSRNGMNRGFLTANATGKLNRATCERHDMAARDGGHPP